MASNPEPFTTEEAEYVPDQTMPDWELASHLEGHEQNALGYY